MTTNKKVIQSMFKAVAEVNQILPKDRRLEESCETILVGQSGKLDSLGLVNLIVAVEQQIQAEFGVAIALANEEVMSQNSSKIQTIGSLGDYITSLLEKKNK